MKSEGQGPEIDLDALEVGARRAWADGSPLPSPCVRVCRIDAQTGWCEGCFRRLEEIGGWASLSEDAKWAIWQRIGQRRPGNKREEEAA